MKNFSDQKYSNDKLLNVFVIAGTEDGRELAGFLIKSGFNVIASVVSDYGRQLLENYNGIKINSKKLDENELVELLLSENVKILVDASHPYAVNVSENAMSACHRSNVKYIRYERQSVSIDYDKIFRVESYEEAAVKAAELGKNIFLTTGSRNLNKFVNSPALRDCNLTARILPTSEVLSQCEELGFNPKNIVALQGPFSTELNMELFKSYNAEVIVSKESGKIGGADTKLTAAKKLNLPVVLIDRPKIKYDDIACTFEDVLKFIIAKSPNNSH